MSQVSSMCAARSDAATARELHFPLAADYEVSCRPVEQDEALASDWQWLEQRAEVSFFLSWAWIGVWLDCYRPAVDVLRVTRRGEVAGLALIVRSRQRRHGGLLRSRTLHLHQVGRSAEDQIWIEYNGVLAPPGEREAIERACIRYLVENYGDWDEFIVGAINERDADVLADHPDLMRHDLWGAPCYGIDLGAIRATGRTYLETLSRNRRYQIRRSRRLYDSMGEVRLRRPGDREEALAFFDALGPLHLARWGWGRDRSGFSNPCFVAFHRELVHRGWAEGNVDLLSLDLDGETVASFYNFVHRGRVYFYLSGVRREADPRLKPGLLGHAMAIQHYLDRGYDFYDFMGGGERYKHSLARVHSHLVQISLQKKRKLKFRIERVGRWFKNSTVDRRGPR